MRKLLLITLLPLAGCAISSETVGPSGKTAHSISCKGAMNSLSNCFEKAASICGKSGYDVIMQDSTTFSRSVLVQCKAPA